MKHYEYTPHGVCSVRIEFDVDGETVRNIRFTRGCSGNTQGVAKLADGMTVDEIISRLKGTDCNGRGTSCPDQLANALEEYKKRIIIKKNVHIILYAHFFDWRTSSC